MVSSLYPPAQNVYKLSVKLSTVSGYWGLLLHLYGRYVCLFLISLLLLVSAPFSGYGVIASSHCRISIFCLLPFFRLLLFVFFDLCVILAMHTVILLVKKWRVCDGILCCPCG